MVTNLYNGFAAYVQRKYRILFLTLATFAAMC